MSEIPELPPLTPRARPLPAGGLDAVVAVGRRRRNQFLGVTGGATTALALVLAAAVALPGERNDSLDYADPEVTAAATAAPSPEPAPSPDAAPEATTAPAAGPQPTPGSGSGAGGGGPQAQEPEPQAAGEAAAPGARAPEQREAYTEQPREYDAPADCRSYQYQTGPLVGAGASCSGGGQSGESTVPSGGTVSATVVLCSPYDGGDAELGFASGREHDVTVLNSNRDQVFRFSDTVTYPQGAHSRRVPEGRCTEWRGVWDTTTTAGREVPPGDYLVRVAVLPQTVNGERAGDLGSIEITVTVTD